jgi:hypothetical protein
MPLAHEKGVRGFSGYGTGSRIMSSHEIEIPAPDVAGLRSAAKAWAGAVVAVFMYVLNSLITGEWADVESIAPALTIILVPLVVWWVKNRRVEDSLTAVNPVTDLPPV